MRGPVGCRFRRVFTCRAEHEPHEEKRACKTSARETRMLSADLDGLGREVTDTVGTARVLAAPRTPTKTDREEHDVSHVPCRPWCRFCVMGRGLERRHLTQSGDREGDRPRVSADCGYLSGDSTPLLVAKDRRNGMTFAAAVSMKGGDPHAARLHAKWIDGLGCQEVTVRTDGEPSICELSFVRRERPLWTRSVLQVTLRAMGLLREPF